VPPDAEFVTIRLLRNRARERLARCCALKQRLPFYDVLSDDLT